MTFDEAFEKLIGHEGGFQNDPEDRGNWTGGKKGEGVLKGTKFGISAMSYPEEDIVNLTLGRAKYLYQRDFWVASGCDVVPEVVRYDAFDTGVNSGPVRAVQFLQRSVGTEPDGQLGPKTKAAIAAVDPYALHARFNGHRLDYINNNPDQWARYGRGWSQRIAEILMET